MTRTRRFEIRAKTLEDLAAGVQDALAALPRGVEPCDVDVYLQYSPRPGVVLTWEEPDPNWGGVQA